jgi:hypothetical protein
MDGSRLFRIAARVAAAQFKRDLQWWQGCCPPPPEEAPKYWRQDVPQDVIAKVTEEKHATTIKWARPDWLEEHSAFERAANELGVDIDELRSKAASGNMSELPAVLWAHLENSDSWRVESMQEAEILAAGHGKDIQSIIDGIAQGKKIPAPIVLLRSGEAPYLIAGNTRLMVSKAMGIVPVVFFIDMSPSHMLSEQLPAR